MTQAGVRPLYYFSRRPTCLRTICKSHLCPAPVGLGPTRQVSQVCEKVFVKLSGRLAP